MDFLARYADTRKKLSANVPPERSSDLASLYLAVDHKPNIDRGNVCLLAFPPSATRQLRLELGFATRFHIFVLPAFTTGSNCPSTVGGGNELKFLLHRSGDTFRGSLYIVRGGVSLGTVETCSPQDLRQEWTVRLSFRVVVGGAISAWIAALASVDSQKWCSFAKS